MKRVLAVFIFSFGRLAFSQVEPRYLSQSAGDSSNAGIGFERNYNTYVWNVNSRYSGRINDYVIDLGERYHSSLIRRENKSLRDEQTLLLSLSRGLTGLLDFRAEASSFILSDNQSLGVSNAAVNSGLAGVALRPVPHLVISPLIGVRFDRQENEKDEGWNYKLSSETDTLAFGDYQSTASLRLHASNLSPRQFRNNAAQLLLRRDFPGGSLDTLRVRWSSNRWDFYVPADDSVRKHFAVSSNIRSRTEEIAGVTNTLYYDTGQRISIVLTTAAESRKIANAFRYKTFALLSAIPFNTEVQELRLEGALDVRYVGGDFFSTVGITVSERDEKHLLDHIEGVDDNFQDTRARQESRLDNVARKTTLRWEMLASFSSRDDLSIRGSAGILRYDTPDTLNNEDRDEALLNLAVRETHRFSPFLEAAVTAEAILAHTVYLYKERSANNNWNRIFRLSPEVMFTPFDYVRTFNAFEVLANYTVFDFETLVPSVKSYSYRQFAFLDSTSYDMTSDIGVDVFFHLRLYERGELRWAEFSERPQQYVQEATFSPQVRYGREGRFLCGVGFRSFAQDRFRYVRNQRVYESDYLSYGPTVSVVLSLSPESRVEVHGWKEFQQQSGKKAQDLSNVAVSVKYYF